MAGMRYQPQGRGQIARSSRMFANVLAVVSAPQSMNLATNAPLRYTGVPGRTGVTRGLALPFRRNAYIQTETLPAVGAGDFTEFWVGYPTATPGTPSGSNEATFVTGSDLNRSGICTSVGSTRLSTAFAGDGNTARSVDWGAVYGWSSGVNGAPNIYTANDSLVPGEFTVLVVVRKASGMEFWRNGTLTNFIPSEPISIPAQTMICGSFIANNSWRTNSDMMLAGRALGAWDAQEVKAFADNPWQLFADPEDELISQAAPGGGALIVTPASLLLGGGEVAMRGTRRVSVQPATLAATDGDISLRAARRLAAQPAALEVSASAAALKAARRVSVMAAGLVMQPGDARLRTARRLTAAPAAMSIASGTIQLQFTPAPSAGSYVMAVTSGALSLTGGSVGMRVTRRVSVAPAALVVTAGGARLLAGYRLAVDPVVLTVVTGQALLRADRRLQIEPAQLAVAGGAVVLRYSQQIEYARAPAGSGYSPQRVEVQARPAQFGGSRPASIQRNVR